VSQRPGIDPPGASGPAVVVTQPFVDRTHYSQLPAFPVVGSACRARQVLYRFPRSAPSASGLEPENSSPPSVDLGLVTAGIYHSHGLISLEKVVIGSKLRQHNTR